MTNVDLGRRRRRNAYVERSLQHSIGKAMNLNYVYACSCVQATHPGESTHMGSETSGSNRLNNMER